MWPFCGTEHYSLTEEYIHGYKSVNKQNSLLSFNIDKYIWISKKKLWKY